MILLFKAVCPDALRGFGDVFFIQRLQILMHVIRALERGGSGFGGGERVTQLGVGGFLFTRLS